MKTQTISTMEVKSLERHGYGFPLHIGKGTHAVVYRVRKESSGTFYACKISGEAGLWKREREILKQLKNPLFPAYVESWQEREKYFLIMEFVSGQTLEALMKRRGCLTQAQAVRFAISLAEGLTYLEGLPGTMLFRDLKAENVRIREDGQIKLLDLACACPAKSCNHTLAGTVGYAAPEQLTVSGKIGAYSDVYAFGRLLHYMLTGDNPCLPPTTKPKIRAYNKNLSCSLERLVEECVQKEPKERLPDMRCVLRKLYDFAAKGENAAGFFGFFAQKTRRIEFIYEKNVFETTCGNR